VAVWKNGTRFPDTLYYTWCWPCRGKVTSLPRGVSLYMVVAIWWEWSKRCGKGKNIIYGCGHAVYRKSCVIDKMFYLLYMYMCVWYIFICFFLLAHLICLCLAMIVYAIHVSMWWCRWSWWGLATERGWSWDFYYYVY